MLFPKLHFFSPNILHHNDLKNGLGDLCTTVTIMRLDMENHHLGYLK